MVNSKKGTKWYNFLKWLAIRARLQRCLQCSNMQVLHLGVDFLHVALELLHDLQPFPAMPRRNLLAFRLQLSWNTNQPWWSWELLKAYTTTEVEAHDVTRCTEFVADYTNFEQLYVIRIILIVVLVHQLGPVILLRKRSWRPEGMVNLGSLKMLFHHYTVYIRDDALDTAHMLWTNGLGRAIAHLQITVKL